MRTLGILAILLLWSASAHGEGRPWTDASGKFHVVADLADVQNGLVYLKEFDGCTVHVPVTKLSQVDRELVLKAYPTTNVIEGHVVAVQDGDTLTVESADKSHAVIRLAGIDAPEGAQAHGAQSKDALNSKVFHKSVRVEWREKGRYDRLVGHVFLDDHWINHELLTEGAAWHYRDYSKSVVLAEAEAVARSKDRGLWAAEKPIAPWEFRKPTPVVATVVPADAAQSRPAAKKASTPVAKTKPKPAPVAPIEEPVDRPSGDGPVTGYSPTGIPEYTGPRGGTYHYSKNGNKVYSKRK